MHRAELKSIIAPVHIWRLQSSAQLQEVSDRGILRQNSISECVGGAVAFWYWLSPNTMLKKSSKRLAGSDGLLKQKSYKGGAGRFH